MKNRQVMMILQTIWTSSKLVWRSLSKFEQRLYLFILGLATVAWLSPYLLEVLL